MHVAVSVRRERCCFVRLHRRRGGLQLSSLQGPRCDYRNNNRGLLRGGMTGILYGLNVPIFDDPAFVKPPAGGKGNTRV